MQLPRAGRVDAIPFARLFGSLAVTGFTGLLRLEQRDRRFSLDWRDGAIVDGESDSPEDTVGRIALEVGMVGPSEIGDSVRRMAQNPGRRQLAILLEMGVVDGPGAARLARLVLSRRALRVFSLPEATYGVDGSAGARDDGAGKPPSLAGPIEARWALYRGLRTYYEATRLERELIELTGHAVRLGAASTLDGFSFSDEERVLLAYLAKGYWEPDDLADACRSLPRPTILAMVLTLWSCDALDVQSADAVSRLRRRGAAARRPNAESAEGAPRGALPTPPPVAPRGTIATPISIAPREMSPTPPPVTSSGRARKLSSPPRPAVPAARAPDNTPTPSPPKRATLDNVASAAAPALREQIEKKLAQIEGGADHFVVLEVERSAGSEAVKTAYFKLAKTYHPDRLALVQLESLRPQVERIFARLAEAFGVLGDDMRRRDYLAGSEKAERADEAASTAHRIVSAEEHFKKGEMALRRQQLPMAAEEFKAALELNDQEPEHHALVGWVMFCQASDKERAFGEAKKLLTRALELNRDCIPAHLYLGQVYRHKGEPERAAGHFQRVLDLDQHHVEALRELRLLDMRKKNEKKPGLFDRFKRK